MTESTAVVVSWEWEDGSSNSLSVPTHILACRIRDQLIETSFEMGVPVRIWFGDDVVYSGWFTFDEFRAAQGMF